MIINPIIQSQKNGAMLSQDIYSHLFSQRIILLIGPINDELSISIIAQLLYLDSLNHDDIQIYISSPGGDVNSAFGIINTMDYVKSDVSVICIGLVASAGALIASSGTKGKRFCLSDTEIMIHQPSSGTSGMASDIEIAAKRIQRIKERINELLSLKTGKQLNTIKNDCERDFFLTAQEAVEYGLVDQIIQ